MDTLRMDDPFDFDSFLDLDSAMITDGMPVLTKGKGIATPEYRAPNPQINTFAPLHQGNDIFSGPSHQYGMHKQHIPLPPGALASSLAATQRIPPQITQYGQRTGMGPSAGAYDEYRRFDSMQRHSSMSGFNDLDMDSESPAEGSFHDVDLAERHIAGGHEEDSPIPRRAEVVRAYPGMHAHQAQQAALAKQQQQFEIQRQQQQVAVQRSQQQMPGYRPTPSRAATHSAVPDPIVEERISRLLNQMRQNSNSTGDAGSKQPGQSQVIRSRKEEDDMDEDERLLASEEGKKLSSKERRQLRNKVSARAFRSRRKEYIGQLEGEVAAKVNEADDLRVECEALRAENARLTDLSKLLLSSPAFSSFLEDLHRNGLPASLAQPQAQPSMPRSQPAAPNMEHQGSVTPRQRHGSSVADQPAAFEPVDLHQNWSTGTDFDFNAQIYAVIDTEFHPDCPAPDTIDTAALSGKSEWSYAPSVQVEKKDQMPSIEVAPVLQQEERHFETRNDIELDATDPAFALFTNSPTPTESSTISFDISEANEYSKGTQRFNLIVEEANAFTMTDSVSVATLARFEALCSMLDADAAVVDRLVGHR